MIRTRLLQLLDRLSRRGDVRRTDWVNEAHVAHDRALCPVCKRADCTKEIR